MTGRHPERRPGPEPRNALDDAKASDARRASGRTLGPLDGIPYTAKASYSAKGLPVSRRLPRLSTPDRQRDAFVIERLRAAGAILLGLTNMPPMANGGMQRGAMAAPKAPTTPTT
jgi:amidase